MPVFSKVSSNSREWKGDRPSILQPGSDKKSSNSRKSESETTMTVLACSARN
eukprot:CAMPEP_0194036408 /NCGR_PEP_ID=MMETSP0009_2-20130614/8745_1 /TAXON_ID=210454 /ORGANISM="Grammatophora oceanica, Strain CCMP 410" /LENGTH=51 /DNA_ID=CAMNT_0038678133 /DNA_START=603 /DNA_END=755 /DNA_ORIENTATION=-